VQKVELISYIFRKIVRAKLKLWAPIIYSGLSKNWNLLPSGNTNPNKVYVRQQTHFTLIFNSGCLSTVRVVKDHRSTMRLLQNPTNWKNLKTSGR